MKQGDFVINKANEVVEFKRAVQINDRAQEVKVVTTLNNKKGLFSHAVKIGSNLITGKATLDKATYKLAADLLEEATKYALDWQHEWRDQYGEPDSIEFEEEEDQ